MVKFACPTLVSLALLVGATAALGEKHEQRQEFFDMGARIAQVEGALTGDASCEVAGQAVALGLRTCS